MKSDQINELATALAKAQSEMTGAKLDAANPHLKNKYASLASYIEAARKPLTDNGLAFTQLIQQSPKGVALETILMHSSGQWMRSKVLINASLSNRGVNEAQAFGSALTYYKRYALASMLGISVESEDDDGQGSGKVQQTPGKSQQQPTPKSGNGKVPIPTTGLELLKVVNEKTDGYYKDSTHLQNAIRKASGNPKWTWPPKDDVDGWREAYTWSVDYAQTHKDKPPQPEQPELT